jgi:tetratricopeptide (TPR) repeat protein
LEAGEAAERVRARALRVQLAVALDYWAFVRRRLKAKGWRHLAAVARAADPDPWRGKVRAALGVADRAARRRALAALAEGAPAEGLPPSAVALLSQGLEAVGAPDRGLALLRQARRRFPGDFWVNHQLAHALLACRPPRREEALRYFAAAVSLRPQSPIAHLNLGYALDAKGQRDEAIAEYREAIRLKEDFAGAHLNLGIALYHTGRLEQAIACFRRAIRLKEGYAEAHNNLGNVLQDKGRLEEAIACYRQAIRLKKDFAPFHNNLGDALKAKGRLDDAIAEYRKAIRIQKDYADAHCNLGIALRAGGRPDEAIACFRRTIRLKKDHALAHMSLGVALKNQGLLDEAIAAYKEAIRHQKDYTGAHYNLGMALRARGRLDEAIACYRKAIALKPDSAEAHCNLGEALAAKGQFPEALASNRRGHELGSKRPGWPYPSGDWVRRAQRLVDLDRKLPAVLAGKVVPANAPEALELAWLCRQPYKRLFAASARFSALAFTADPALADDLAAGYRYAAACAAALAAAGKGEGAGKLTDKERARLRGQALDWLKADLILWAPFVQGTGPQRQQARGDLARWRPDPALAGVRDQADLARLPQAEGAAWRKLWAGVDSLLKRTQDKK